MQFKWKTSELDMCWTCEAIKLKYIEHYVVNGGKELIKIVCPGCGSEVETVENA